MGIKPLYNPPQPSFRTASPSASYTPRPSRDRARDVEVGVEVEVDVKVEDEEDAMEEGEVSASWKRTLMRSRGCMTKVATVPAPRPATAWSYVTASDQYEGGDGS